MMNELTMTPGAVGDLQVVDMAAAIPSAWPNWTGLVVPNHEFRIAGGRTVRIMLAERLAPGQPTAMRATHVTTHRNAFDVLGGSIWLPLPHEGVDMADPIGGTLVMRAEDLLYVGGGPMPDFPPPKNHVEVNFYIQTEGPSRQRMINLDEIAKMIPLLEGEHPGAVDRERNQFIAPDGSVRELMEACWERLHGRAFPFPTHGRTELPFALPVLGFEELPAPGHTGVRIRPIHAFGARGPSVCMVKLASGASLPGSQLMRHRFGLLVAGHLRAGDSRFGQLTSFFAAPGARFPDLFAEESSLLYLAEWEPDDAPLATCWRL